MMTKRGEIPDSELQAVVKVEDIPCGTCVTTSYFASDGELVRQDVAVAVTKAPGLESSEGDLNGDHTGSE